MNVCYLAFVSLILNANDMLLEYFSNGLTSNLVTNFDIHLPTF